MVPEHTWTVVIAEKDGSRVEDSLSRPASKPMPAVDEIVTTDGNREIVVERITEPEGAVAGNDPRPTAYGLGAFSRFFG